MAKTKKIKLSDLTPDDQNFNKGTEFGTAALERSIRENGMGRSILVDRKGRIIAGNKTTEAAGALGITDVIEVEVTGEQMVAVKRVDLDLDTPEGRRMAFADNQVGKLNLNFDAELVAEHIDKETRIAYGFESENSESGTPYTSNVKAPTYEPKNEKPQPNDLFDSRKTEELIAEIRAANIDEETRRFLIAAAQRHTIFSFEKIADFYAHSAPEVQLLMEKSALVIIDFEKAIENGFTRLGERLELLMENNVFDE